MSASKVLDQAEQQGLLEPKVIDELRLQVAESKFVVTPEALAKVLVDRGHLTGFQARKLVATALNVPAPEPEATTPKPARPASPPPRKAASARPDELGLADEELDSESGFPQSRPPVEEDIVMMEAVEPVPRDPAPKPTPAPTPKPATKPVFTPPKDSRSRAETKVYTPPAGKTSSPKAPAALPTSDELIDLDAVPGAPQDAPKPAARPAPKPAAPSPPPKPSSWKSPPAAPPAPADGLVPLTAAESARPTATSSPPAAVRSSPPMGPGVAPQTDLLADPMALPADPLSGKAKAAAAQTGGRRKRNVWDSPLLLVGGGALGVMIVVAGLLLLSLTWGNAAEFFAKAEEEYKNGAYSNAMAMYESFLEQYPENSNASLAKVRLGMSELRQVSGEGQNPKQGLTTAQRVLPVIKDEVKFDEARVELAAILPDIADGFAMLAAQAQTTAQKEELVRQADEAMKLVNDAAYIPATLRKERETRIAEILDKLKVAQRSIEQDKELAIALERIRVAGEQGDAAGAYKLRFDLLKVYPALATHADLLTAIRSVGDRERDLVKVSPETVAAATDDPQTGGLRLVLTVREGPAPAATAARIAFIQIEGAVYGIDADSGRSLWRRHVGIETLVPPQPIARQDLADALVADARKHELLRLEAASGKVVWRQAIGQPFFAPTIADQRIFVTTKAGRIVQLDAASGGVVSSVQLPQTATVAAAYDSRQSRLVQLGQHSTVFVLSSSTLECTETFYLGHLAGTVLVPPVSVLDHVIAVESPADDHTLLHVLAPDAESKRLVEMGKPLRLRGRVVMPLSVDRRSVVAMTDLGEIAVYEVSSTDKDQPVRVVAELAPTERTPALGFYTAAGNRLWLAGRRCSMFEIQPAVQQLARKWSKYQDDVFVAPLVALGDVLIHSRRKPGIPGVVVTGCSGATGTPIWETQLGVPLAGLLPAPSRKAVDAVTTQGRVYSLAGELANSAVLDAPAFALPQGSAGSIWPELAFSADGQMAGWTETQTAGRAFAYNLATGTPPASAALPDGGAAAAPAIAWGKNLVAPLRSGQVTLLDVGAGRPAALPFQPQLSPDAVPNWTRPALLADDSGFVIGDGRTTLYRVVLKPQPQSLLTVAAEQTTPLEIRGNLVAAGDTVYGLGRSDAGQSVVAIDAQTLALGATRWQLTGQPLFGLAGAGGLAFVATEADGLLCLEGGQKQRWKVPLAHGPLAGPPLTGAEGELLLLYQSGFLSRASAQTGEELAAGDVGEPLGRAACLVGQQVYVSTSDGGVVVVPLPQ